MRVLPAALPVFAAFSASVAILLQCSPEELVYAPTGGPADGSAGASGASGAGGTGSWAEVCGNGIDDDNDGKSDCDDPNCEATACVDPAPAGFSGPVALFMGPAGSLPECPAGLSELYLGGANPSFEPSGCTGCTCGAPSGESCSISVTYYQSSTCSTYASSGSVSSSCSATYSGTVGSVQVSASPTGNCAPGPTPTPTLSPAAFADEARACGIASGTPATCEAGGVCSPASSQAAACIFQSGDVECPSTFPTRHVFHESLNDSRGCAACSCSFDATSCSVTLTAYQDTGCSLPLTTTGTGCLTGDVHAFSINSQSVSGETCVSNGANPTGCASGDSPTTFCCADADPCPSGGGPSMVKIPDLAGGTYCIDSTEVTRAQYAAFLATNPPSSGQPPECSWNTDLEPENWNPSTADDRPVGGVDWCDAVAFCAWAGKRLCGKIGGGPVDMSSDDDASQNEWFNACSKGDTQTYAYGSKYTSGACGGSNDGVKSHECCVGGFPGVYGLSGGVEEWEDSCEASVDENDDCLTRGPAGCGNSDPESRDQTASNIGFRCCAS